MYIYISLHRKICGNDIDIISISIDREVDKKENRHRLGS